jgi:hypothetical protein
MRTAYTTLGLGRARVGMGLADRGGSNLDEGLKLLESARWQFRDLDYAPGEYVAHRHLNLTRAKLDQLDDESEMEFRREANSLAQRTHVLRFELEAGWEYANALYRYGRLVAAHVVIDRVRANESDPMAIELKYEPIWEEVRALVEKTKDAHRNAIDPRQRWGCSQFARDESRFMEDVVDACVLISAYGQSGCGRRIFLNRVAEARGLTDEPVILDGAAGSQEVLEELQTHLGSGAVIVLYNFDRWPKDLQRQTLVRLSRTRDGFRQAYATLTKPLRQTNVTNRLERNMVEMLTRGTWDIKPLTARPEDTLMLARGFLMRSFSRRGGAAADANLIFTGEACRYIREAYSQIADLYRVMRFLALRLDLTRDTISAGDGRYRIPADALYRHLGPRQRRDTLSPTTTGDGEPDSQPRQFGREILEADEEMIRDLAQKTGGRMARLNEWTTVPRATIVRAWTKRGMMEIWRNKYHGRTRRVPAAPGTGAGAKR